MNRRQARGAQKIIEPLIGFGEVTFPLGDLVGDKIVSGFVGELEFPRPKLLDPSLGEIPDCGPNSGPSTPIPNRSRSSPASSRGDRSDLIRN